MSSPVVVSVSPDVSAQDVVLGQNIVVTFDQVINTDTVNNATFALIGPTRSAIVSPDQIVENNPSPRKGTGFTLGTFTFATINNQTVSTFIPSQPMVPGSVYKVLLVGKDSVSGSIFGSYIANNAGEVMLQSYQWEFNTGTLNVNIPPIQNPVSTQTVLYPEEIQLVPRNPVGNDLSTIELIFPAPLDLTTFNLSDILVGIEPILNDPDVVVPSSAAATAIVQGNKIIVTVTGV